MDDNNEINSNKFLDFVAENWKGIIILLLAFAISAAIGIGLWIIYNSIMNRMDKIEDQNKAIIATPTQAVNPNWLQNTTGMSQQNARDTVTIIERAQEGSVQPASTIVIQAPTATEAAVEVKEKIDKKDPTLPKDAIKYSDHTIVSEQPNNQEFKVGVYKINNYRKWAVGTGIGTFDNKPYIPVALEYKFDQFQSVEAQINIDARSNYSGSRVNGGQIMYKLHF